VVGRARERLPVAPKPLDSGNPLAIERCSVVMLTDKCSSVSCSVSWFLSKKTNLQSNFATLWLNPNRKHFFFWTLGVFSLWNKLEEVPSWSSHLNNTILALSEKLSINENRWKSGRFSESIGFRQCFNSRFNLRVAGMGTLATQASLQIKSRRLPIKYLEVIQTWRRITDFRELKQQRRRRLGRCLGRRLVKNEFIFYQRNSRLSRSVRYAEWR